MTRPLKRRAPPESFPLRAVLSAAIARGIGLRIRHFVSTLTFFVAVTPAHSAAAVEQERVVLLHGLARTSRSMAPLAKRLREAGFNTHNLDYPSRRQTPAELVTQITRMVRQCCADLSVPVHFVGHSMGGILIRAYLEAERPRILGRAVQLAPPNQGSEIVDSLARFRIFGVALGPSAVELGTSSDSFPNRLGHPDYEIGVIAGRRSFNLLGSWLIPGPDDGMVALDRTRLEGSSDFLAVDATHSFIMRGAEVAEQVVHFLRSGMFDHRPE